MMDHLEIIKVINKMDYKLILLFNNNKIGYIDMNNFINLPPYYMLKNIDIFSLVESDKERLYWGNKDNSIIDIHIDQFINNVRFIYE